MMNISSKYREVSLNMSVRSYYLDFNFNFNLVPLFMEEISFKYLYDK